MARRILNRKELRDEHDASVRVEEEDLDERDEDASEEEEAKPAKKEEAKPVKKATRRKPRAKAGKEVRLKAFWGVFGQSLNQVAQFEHSQRAEAVTKAAELSESRKSPHFVQLVKKVIEE
jgi:hypothetical protein